MNEDLTPDELAPLFEGKPDGPSLEQRYRQGTILTFDPVTLENTVDVGGSVFEDLPLLGVGEATLLVPGAAVGLTVIGGPSKTMYITGRIVTPGTADAANAVALLNSQLYTDFVSSPSGDTCSSATYGDLATVGPEVVVPIGPSGRILVMATAQIQWISATAATTIGDGRFDVAFSGANSRTPNEAVDPLVGIASYTVSVSAGTNTFVAIGSVTTQAVFSGLTPGETVITMKYRRSVAATQDPQFFRRTLTVFKL